MPRLLIQPRDREEEGNYQRRYYYPTERYKRVAGEEHQHLVIEHKEPLGPGDVGIGADVHRFRERCGYQVRQGDNDRQEKGRADEVHRDLPGEEPHRLVRTVVDVLLGYNLPLFYRL